LAQTGPQKKSAQTRPPRESDSSAHQTKTRLGDGNSQSSKDTKKNDPVRGTEKAEKAPAESAVAQKVATDGPNASRSNIAEGKGKEVPEPPVTDKGRIQDNPVYASSTARADTKSTSTAEENVLELTEIFERFPSIQFFGDFGSLK
jgi:hypothetical protein